MRIFLPLSEFYYHRQNFSTIVRIFLWLLEFLCCCENFILPREFFCCCKKNFLVARIFLLLWEFFLVVKIFLFENFFSVVRNFFCFDTLFFVMRIFSPMPKFFEEPYHVSCVQCLHEDASEYKNSLEKK